MEFEGSTSSAAPPTTTALSSDVRRRSGPQKPKGERRVRFADSVGMELVSIFLFDLISNYYFVNILSHQQYPNFICEFTQPISLISFKERVRLNKVHLETCNTNSNQNSVTVTCTIRVLNLAYYKSVIVRYTTDSWHTFTDCAASYKPGSCDGWSDKFISTFNVTNQVKHFQTGQRVQFAVRYATGKTDLPEDQQVYWDNNAGLNYSIKRA